MIGATIAMLYLAAALIKLNVKKRQVALFVILVFAVRYYMQDLIPGHELNVWNTPPVNYFNGWGFLAIAVTLLCVKFFKWPVWKVLDQGSIALMLASSIGRIGCFLNGCSGGKVCDLPWAMVFPGRPEVRVHPAQLYMFFLETLLWVVLFFINKKKRFDGETFWVGLLLYSIYKFGIEFVRTNPVFLWGLTHTQFFSIFLFIGACVGLFLGFYQVQKPRSRIL
jgi:phosphatidylglycerol:prolipoprotein diacylglycerol transferase